MPKHPSAAKLVSPSNQKTLLSFFSKKPVSKPTIESIKVISSDESSDHKRPKLDDKGNGSGSENRDERKPEPDMSLSPQQKVLIYEKSVNIVRIS